jgi:hypothetical protein
MRPVFPDAFFFLFVVSWLVCGTSALADPLDIETALIAVDSLGLAEDPTWRRLLHFEPGKQTSSVLTDSFFLSPEGRFDPRTELTAMLSAYFQPDVVDDSHPRCRFPARYYWLSHQLELPDYQLRQLCANLEGWELFEKTHSVSLLMVSGYLGNPASTFGHSLLKLNTVGSRDVPSLFDPTVNFGAMVPQQENPVLYILRGLTGGYEAGFSDKYYYTQDLVYSRTEFRDMWEYRLALTEYQRLLLGLHVWEIVGKKYKYFFLGRNCGFRLAELLDLVLEEELLGDTGLWYAPVDLFHRLDEINSSRVRAGEPELITSVTYIPSARRKLVHELSDLDDTEIRIMNQLLNDGTASIDRRLKELAMDRQIAVLNGLLAFHHYLDTADGPHLNAARKKGRNQILLARLKRPTRQVTPAAVPDLAPPTKGFRPTTTGIGAGVEPGKHLFTLLTWSPYRQESVGYNSLEGGELIVADVEVGLGGRSSSVFLSRFEMIRLLNLSTMPMRVLKDRGLSWRLRIGVDRHAREGDAYDGVASFGAGRAWKGSRRVTGFGLVNIEVHTHGSFARVRPEFRVLYDGGNLRATVGLDLISTGYAGDLRRRSSWRLLYRLGQNRSLETEHRPGSDVTTVAISRYF